MKRRNAPQRRPDRFEKGHQALGEGQGNRQNPRHVVQASAPSATGKTATARKSAARSASKRAAAGKQSA